MRISRAGRTGDIFLDELKKVAKKMPGSDEHIDQRLDKARDIRGQAHETGTEEVILADDRKHDKTIGQQLTEKNLRKHDVDDKVEKVIEKQLEDAPKKNKYPHRNAAAYERTGNKRPINALDEEMGNAGDASKVDRYEKASTSGKKRILDKDIGSQLTNEKTKIKNAFNLKQQRGDVLLKTAGEYLAYRDDKKAYNQKFAEVTNLDSVMTSIMTLSTLEKRPLSDDEKAKISALKEKKSELLKVAENK